jgi:hypothetical protein
MANQEQNLQNPDSQPPGVEPGEHCNVDASRRKFTGAGLGVSAIFTLASQPVLAGVCRAPSGAESGNLSQPGTQLTCDGHSPSYWSGISGADPYLDTKFHDIFDKSKDIVDYDGETVDWGGKAKMKKVMDDENRTGDAKKPQPLGAEFAAAWVNVKKGLIPGSVLTDTRLITMWTELLRTGVYVPMAGADPWSPQDVINYLRGLQVQA